MQFVHTDRFARSYRSSPVAVQRAFDRKSVLMLRDLRHPPLRTKKYDDARAIWQGRINRSWRFYFMIDGDTYVLLDMMPHP